MRVMHQINKWALIITLFLYITVYFGMMAQIILGFLQLLFALIITIGYYYELPINYQKLIKRYWIAVMFSGLYIAVAYWYDSNYTNDFLMITSLFIFPMTIAIYFAYITGKISKLYIGKTYK